jgi:hypothetical protein
MVALARNEKHRKEGRIMTKFRSETMDADMAIQILTTVAVEIYTISGEDGEDEIGLIRDAIPLVTLAWDLGEKGSAALALVKRQLEIYRSTPDDEAVEIVVDKELLHLTLSPAEMMDLLWTLVETSERLDKQEDRAKIVDLTHYLKDFWNLAERIAS